MLTLLLIFLLLSNAVTIRRDKSIRFNKTIFILDICQFTVNISVTCLTNMRKSLELILISPPRPHAFTKYSIQSDIRFKSVLSLRTFLLLILGIIMWQGRFLSNQFTHLNWLSDTAIVFIVFTVSLSVLSFSMMNMYKKQELPSFLSIIIHIFCFLVSLYIISLFHKQFSLHTVENLPGLAELISILSGIISGNITWQPKCPEEWFNIISNKTSMFATTDSSLRDVVGTNNLMDNSSSNNRGEGSSSGPNYNPGCSSTQASGDTTASIDTNTAINPVINGPSDIPVRRDEAASEYGPISYKDKKLYAATHTPECLEQSTAIGSSNQRLMAEVVYVKIDREIKDIWRQYAGKSNKEIVWINNNFDYIKNNTNIAAKNILKEKLQYHIDELHNSISTRFCMYNELKRVGANLNNKERWSAIHVASYIKAKNLLKDLD